MPTVTQISGNIGPKARRLRAIMGVFSLALAIVLWLWLTFLAEDVNLWLRLLFPIPPLYIGLLGVLQAQRQT
ncbi:MAG: hypothetical protein L3J82_09080 [Planctomycetes bacterium]|nr:hypothetical protein [Planctomycetota bacterium]